MRVVLIVFVDGEWRFRYGPQWSEPGPMLWVGGGREFEVRHVTEDSAREDYGMRFRTLQHVPKRPQK